MGRNLWSVGDPGQDEDLHLSTATERELKRLAAHPVQEMHRLQEDVRKGEKGSTMVVLVGGMALWLWLLAAVVIVLSFLVAYALTR